MPYLWGYLIFFALNTVLVFIEFVWTPDYVYHLSQEDGLFENLTAAFLLFSCLFATLYLIRRNAFRKTLIVISAVGLLGFLDELSFGERIFELSMPVIKGVKIDAAHDLFELGFVKLADIAPNHAVYIYFLAGAGVVLGTAFALYRSAALRRRRSFSSLPAYALLAIFMALGVSALFIDSFGYAVHRFLPIMPEDLIVWEELIEMNAAIALLVACLCLARYRLRNPSPYQG